MVALINRTWLAAFHAVALHAGFNRAAQRQGVTQSTLSAQVAELERAYSVELFSRDRKRITLTRVGQELFEVTKRLQEAENDARALLLQANRDEAGRLRLGATRSHDLVTALTRFTELYPSIVISLTIGTSSVLLRLLLDRLVDAVVIAASSSDPNITQILLLEEPIVAIVPKDHVLADQGSITLADLVKHRLIMRSGDSLTRTVLEAEFAKRSLASSREFECNEWEALCEMVAQDLGVSAVPYSVAVEDPRMAILTIEENRIVVPQYLTFMRDMARMGALANFIQLTNEG
jgi:DNA-binding transcriptional LysR family regulator